jgi:Flp pilus assembly protein TadD
VIYFNKKSHIIGALLILLGSACAMPARLDGPPRPSREKLAAPEAAVPASPEVQAARAETEVIHTDLIRSMLAQGQYYAALAHVEAQKGAQPVSPGLRLLEAEARRKLGQNAEAVALYTSLLRGPEAAPAHHGLGLVYAGNQQLGPAVQHLQQAVRLRPTDVEFRNDLGYALMIAGRYPEALTQLATAVELDPDGSRSRNNLILLLLVTGDEARAVQLARDSGLNASALAGLRAQAQSLSRGLATVPASP